MENILNRVRTAIWRMSKGSATLDDVAKLLAELPPEVRVQIGTKLVADSIDAESYYKFAPLWEAEGVHIVPNAFYSPLPDFRELPDSLWTKPRQMDGVDMNDEGQLALLDEVLTAYLPELEDLPVEATNKQLQFFWENGNFSGIDVVVLHSFIRHYKPKRIIEIGSGFQTLISTRAAAMNGETQITAIEPHPRRFLRRLKDIELMVTPMQKVDLQLFDELEENDILFIDTSHVSTIGSDVNRVFFEILPRLKTGVHIQLHDIFLPFHYPHFWVKEQRRAWNEQYMLQAILTENQQLRVRFAVAYMMNTAHVDRLDVLPETCLKFGGSSFWMTKVSDA